MAYGKQSRGNPIDLAKRIAVLKGFIEQSFHRFRPIEHHYSSLADMANGLSNLY
ncbi:hypothetical protein JX580_00125 [Thiomicrospira microaerophila]|uniref:hypothetical protein n=1 Tax=Thiomicrospira microaerophila TaxID=406020 RepID=UPI00200C669F|nr:hypothetical protein [Thiomicrospira microaerophila]UQB42360.1 hypothetical protein JX580_00125 [Thiomicrospira microaerophila]